MATFPERLNEALEMKGMSAADLARESGVSEPNISRYRKGEFMPKDQQMTKLASVLGVAPDWLSGKSTVMEPDTKFRMDVAPSEHDLIVKIRNMPAAQRKFVVDFIDYVSTRPGR